jgi:hypothetical protein
VGLARIHEAEPREAVIGNDALKRVAEFIHGLTRLNGRHGLFDPHRKTPGFPGYNVSHAS